MCTTTSQQTNKQTKHRNERMRYLVAAPRWDTVLLLSRCHVLWCFRDNLYEKKITYTNEISFILINLAVKLGRRISSRSTQYLISKPRKLLFGIIGILLINLKKETSEIFLNMFLPRFTGMLNGTRLTRSFSYGLLISSQHTLQYCFDLLYFPPAFFKPLICQPTADSELIRLSQNYGHSSRAYPRACLIRPMNSATAPVIGWKRPCSANNDASYNAPAAISVPSTHYVNLLCYLTLYSS